MDTNELVQKMKGRINKDTMKDEIVERLMTLYPNENDVAHVIYTITAVLFGVLTMVAFLYEDIRTNIIVMSVIIGSGSLTGYYFTSTNVKTNHINYPMAVKLADEALSLYPEKSTDELVAISGESWRALHRSH